MSPKELLIAHAEKVVVAVVAVIGGWMVYDVLGDPSIRPEKANETTIQEKIDRIQKVMSSQKPPTLTEPVDYLAQMKQRFRAQLPTDSYPSWIFALPDIGPVDSRVGKGFPYIYELLAPTLAAHDAIGSIALEITLPAGSRPTDRRIADAPKIEWSRSDGGTIVNGAEQLAVQIEFKIGESPWQPLKVKDLTDNGLIPLAKLTALKGKITVDAIEAWERHHFRARMVAKATGHPLTGAAGDQSVLVVAGAYDGDTDTDALAALAKKLEQSDAPTVKRFLKGGKTPLPAGVALKPGELVYTGNYSDDVLVLASAEVRFAFKGFVPDDNDPTLMKALMLVTRQFKTEADPTKTVWLKEPVAFKVPKGLKVGEKLQNKLLPKEADPRQTPQDLDLTTPFEVAEMRREIKRIYYYSLRPKARPNSRAKDIEMSTASSEVSTDVVVLKNTKTGAIIELAKLSIIRPVIPANGVIYPNFKGQYDEPKEFRDNPVGFQQLPLIPQEPKKWNPEEAPLVDLAAKDSAYYSTDTPYYELPDGRLYWYQPGKRQVCTENLDPDGDKGIAATGEPVPEVPKETPKKPDVKPAPKPPTESPKPPATGKQPPVSSPDAVLPNSPTAPQPRPSR